MYLMYIYLRSMCDVETFLGEKGLPLRVGFNVQRGYHVQIYGNRRAPLMKIKELPNHFLNPMEGKNTIAFTTEEIIQADKRGQEALCEITVMSNSIIEELLQGVRESIGCLYKVRQAVWGLLPHVFNLMMGLINNKEFKQPALDCLIPPNKLSEIVSLLDVILSLAEVSQRPGFVRPGYVSF